MRLSLAPHPSLCNGEIHRTFLDVSPNESLECILSRSRPLLALWLFPLGGDTCHWQLQHPNGRPLDPFITPIQLQLNEDALIYVTLTNNCSAQDTAPEAVDTSPVDPPASALMPKAVADAISASSTDLQEFVQAKEAAVRRARAIENEEGIRINHRKIFHDEAVEDYDEEYYNEEDADGEDFVRFKTVENISEDEASE